MGNSKINDTWLDRSEGAVVMTRSNVEEFGQRRRRANWEAVLPKRKAWLQTLILLPFGLSVANFLGASWHFSVNAIVEERQYLIGVLSMVINLVLPSLFFAFLFHWGWFVWRQKPPTWYPQSQGLWAGVYATLTIAASFGLVGLFTHSLGVCGNPTWGSVSQTLLCNLDGYGFESKSWFGAWFIIAAYFYQAQGSIAARSRRIFDRRHHSSPDDFRATSLAQPILPGNIDTIAEPGED
jgi:hypothetical protein